MSQALYFDLDPIWRGFDNRIAIPGYASPLSATMGLDTGDIVATFKPSMLDATTLFTASILRGSIFRTITTDGELQLDISIPAASSRLFKANWVWFDLMHLPADNSAAVPIPVTWQWPVANRLTVPS